MSTIDKSRINIISNMACMVDWLVENRDLAHAQEIQLHKSQEAKKGLLQNDIFTHLEKSRNVSKVAFCSTHERIKNGCRRNSRDFPTSRLGLAMRQAAPRMCACAY